MQAARVLLLVFLLELMTSLTVQLVNGSSPPSPKKKKSEESSTQLTTPLLEDMSTSRKRTPPREIKDYISDPKINRTNKNALERQTILRMRHVAVRSIIHENYQPPTWDDVKGKETTKESHSVSHQSTNSANKPSSPTSRQHEKCHSTH